MQSDQLPRENFMQNGGTVIGGGTFDKGDTTTLTATPKLGYNFVGWYRISDQQTATLVSNEPNYSVVVTRDRTFEARFEKEIKTCKVTVYAYGEGTATGGGDYNIGDTVTLTATPNQGYEFFGWVDDGKMPNLINGDFDVSVRSRDTTWSFAVDKSLTLYAVFLKDDTAPDNPGQPDTPQQPDNPGGGNNPTQPQQQSGKVCKYCGGTHTGFPGVLIGFFHSILALFGLRK